MKLKQVITMAAMCMSGMAAAQNMGVKPENLDTTALPGTDFYQFACGGWMKNNPLQPEYSRFGSFDVVSETNRKQIQSLIEDLQKKTFEKGSVGQKISDLYKMAMDSTRMNRDGVAPIMDDLKRIQAVKTLGEFVTLMAENGSIGGQELWGSYIGADMMSSKENLLEIVQGGYNIERDYYVKKDEQNLRIFNEYKKHVVNMLKLVGYSEAEAKVKMENALAVEVTMATIARDNVALRDPASNYNKMSYAQFKKEYNTMLAGRNIINWDKYFAASGITGIQTLSVGQPEAIKKALDVLRDTPLPVLKDWMEWGWIDGHSSTLGDKVYEEVFNFNGRIISGAQQPQPRWKRAVGTVNGVLGEAVGQMYVEKYFPAANKARMQQLVKNLQVALGERIDAQEWMSDATKKAAHEKLDAFTVKIGYPDKWRDYSALNIDPALTMYENMKNVRRWAVKESIARKWKKPVDPTEWHMTPQTVNAYYNPTTNEICFPAGILQYPFFDMEADDAFNYGAIGVVIGHEMTHGFDDQGRQFDKDGNFKDWWAEGDGDKFKARAQVMNDFFSAIDVLPDLKANGSLTLGENLADHGGLQVAYYGLKAAMAGQKGEVKGGFTPEQRFFLAYAGVWGQNITEAEIRRRTVSDPHALGMWRVNGALPHIDMWYDAFGITEKDPMFVPKEQRVTIW